MAESWNHYDITAMLQTAINQKITTARNKPDQPQRQTQPQKVNTTKRESPLTISLPQGELQRVTSRKHTLRGKITNHNLQTKLLIDGEKIALSSNGNFSKKLTFPIGITEVMIVATDSRGNEIEKLVTIHRKVTNLQKNKKQITLSPPEEQIKHDPNALAIIIGVDEYELASSAPWSNSDAALFYDYANTVLGVDYERIKLLRGEEAKGRDIWKSFSQWVPALSEPNQSNIYVFFAGHGLASEDGTDAYIVPWDGDPELLERTAILRKDLIEGLQRLAPKSVTLFMDTCYSGTGKGGKSTLVADARALRMIRDRDYRELPENFTLFSASANNEIASSHPTQKHGLFSYWMMRGLGGDADSNNDQKITAGELHGFISKNVQKDAVSIGRQQHPQLVGDSERVIAAW